MAKVLEFKSKNVIPFTLWLKKFIISSTCKSLLLEVDKENRQFIAKTHNDERSIVKFSKISFEDAGLEIKTQDSLNQRIKIGIYSIPRLIKSLEQFTGEFSIGFKYDEIIGENAGFAGIGILLKNSSIKLNVECSSLHIFKYITDDQFLNKIAKVNPIISFNLSTNNIEQINSLSNLDAEYYKFLDFKVSKGILVIRGKTFELNLFKSDNKEEGSISIYKDQFDKIDLEDYSIDLAEDRIVYKSNNSESIIVTSMVERDEKYDESLTDF